MIVLIDTNVVFDVISKRQPHYSASNQLFCLCRRQALTGIIALHTLANVYYYYGAPAGPFIRERLLTTVEVGGASAATIQKVMEWGMKDWEDALQCAVAQTVKASFIISRNTRDFRLSKTPALTPKEFLTRFHPHD